MHAVRRPGRRLSAGVAVAALFLMPGLATADHGPALADCMPAPGLEQAIGESDRVFVGTVASVEHDGRSAMVEVRDVWRGAEMAATVTVVGGQDPAQPMEDDRTFEAGITYLFLPSLIDGRMVDSICSATTPWTESLVALRPVDAHTPASAEEAVATGLPAIVRELTLPVLTAALIAGAALTIAFVVARWRDA